MDSPNREDGDSDGVFFSPPHNAVGNRSSWSYLRNAESCPTSCKSLKRRSSSFVAVQSALFQLNCLEDFDLEKIGEGFFARVYKVNTCNQLHILYDPNGQAYIASLYMEDMHTDTALTGWDEHHSTI